MALIGPRKREAYEAFEKRRHVQRIVSSEEIIPKRADDHRRGEQNRQADQGIRSQLAAPFGTGKVDVAAKGELNVLAGGDPSAIEAMRPLLDVIGGRIWDMGTEAPTANAAKIACNMMITMAIEAMAEAMVLTEANGLARDRFFELILGTLFGSRSYQVYSANIARGDYEPGFKAVLGLKDLRLAAEAAEQAGRSLPMLRAVHSRMSETVDAGMGERDWSAMAEFTITSSK